MPPSAHPSGSRRSWRTGFSPEDIDIAAAPTWLLRLIRREQLRREKYRVAGSPGECPAEFEALFTGLGIVSNGRAKGVYRCPWHDDESESLSIAWDKAAFKCFASSCGKQGYIGTLRMLTRGVAS